MKKIYYVLIGGLLALSTSCQKQFIDLSPQDQITETLFFKQPSDFKAYSTSFYSQLMGWASPYGGNSVFQNMDVATDLSTYFNFSSDVGRGTISPLTSDNRWDNNYKNIRIVNILLQKAASYTGGGSISQYVGEAYFFRAYAYYNLLKFYGGVPIVTTVLELNSPELTAARNSRYEVVDQILSDLSAAINNLPAEQNIAAADKGRISKWAAEAFKAQVELYEATWRKYNGRTTDFAGSAGPASDQTATFLADAVALSQDVMSNGGYSLWNYNSTPSILNQSYTYLFNLEDAASNPAGLTKATNNEFILYGVYDYTLRRGGQSVSFTSMQMLPTRKMIDMFLCTDGLPPEKSPLFKGYHQVGDEYQNRDLRLTGYVNPVPASGSIALIGLGGYGNLKFVSYHYGSYRADGQESFNFPIIRLAQVYLTYAEALYELNGAITDAQLDASINKIRDRAGVAHLSNALVNTNGLNMLNEIRRERTLELYHEGFRFDDLKRWGIAESALNPSRCGEVVGGASYSTEFRTSSGAATSLYKPNNYVWGEESVATPAGALNCVVLDGAANHTFAKKHYLWPLPLDQISANPNLKQNPGY